MKDLEISKELLSEVLNLNVVSHSLLNKLNNSFDITYMQLKDNPYTRSMPINIYEFAFIKCKEWAFKNKYKIQSQINESNKGHSHITKKNDDCWAKGFFEDTEIEAVIKASEYILKEINENR